MPEDATKFPVSVWLKRLLIDGIQPIMLNSNAVRSASPPGQNVRFEPDGSNLPHIIRTFRKRPKAPFKRWLAHLQTAFPDLEDVETIERQDDKHVYLMLRYRGGLRVPSWMASDGTLRLLALTLPAYASGTNGVFLIEEPENGVHPLAIEAMFQSLSSVFDSQVLLATHSPVVLSLADVKDVLCFAKTPEGAVDIVLGSRHPALSKWRNEPNLALLFAGGVLG